MNFSPSSTLDSSRSQAALDAPQTPKSLIGQNVTSTSPSLLVLSLSLIFTLLQAAPALSQQTEGVAADWLAQAKQAELAHNFSQAAECYTAFLKESPDRADIWQRLGLVYYLDNRFDQAVPALERAAGLDMSLWGANLFLGISEYRMGQFDRAQKSLEAALKVKPDVAEGQYWLGSTLMARGQHEAAVMELEKVPASSSVAMDADYLLAQEYRRVAEGYYQEIGQTSANSYRAHQLAAESFAWAAKYQNAILEYRRALQLNPGLEGAHRGIAEMYWEQRQFEQAAQEYATELQKFPLDDEAHMRIGEFRLSQGKVVEAVPQLESALQVNKGSWELDRALGQASIATGDMAKAQSWLESATKINPSDPFSHQLLADVYRTTGHSDLAGREQSIFQKLSAAERN